MIYSLFFSLQDSLYLHLNPHPSFLLCLVLHHHCSASKILLLSSVCIVLELLPLQSWSVEMDVYLSHLLLPSLVPKPCHLVPPPWPHSLMLGLLWESLHALPFCAVWGENILAEISWTILICPLQICDYNFVLGFYSGLTVISYTFFSTFSLMTNKYFLFSLCVQS